MVYESPFNLIKEGHPAIYERWRYKDSNNPLNYSGTLESVFSEMHLALKTGDRLNGASVLGFHPPRIINAIIKWKISNPGLGELELLIRDSVELGLGIYRGDEDSVVNLERLMSQISSKYPNLMEMEIDQPTSIDLSLVATYPDTLVDVANELSTKFEEDSLLFIPLASGGVAPGMDIYLRYLDITGNTGSLIYPVRFSVRQREDPNPYLTSTELDFISEKSKGRKVVVFDEDVCTGVTQNRALKFFKEELFSDDSKPELFFAYPFEVDDDGFWDGCVFRYS